MEAASAFSAQKEKKGVVGRRKDDGSPPHFRGTTPKTRGKGKMERKEGRKKPLGVARKTQEELSCVRTREGRRGEGRETHKYNIAT